MDDYFPVEIQAYLLNEPATLDDALIGAFARDITREKAVENDRRMISERFRKVFDAAPAAMLIVNENGLIKLVNQTTTEMFGYRHDELIGLSVEQLFPDHARKRHPGLRAGFQARGQTRNMGSAKTCMRKVTMTISH